MQTHIGTFILSLKHAKLVLISRSLRYCRSVENALPLDVYMATTFPLQRSQLECHPTRMSRHRILFSLPSSIY